MNRARVTEKIETAFDAHIEKLVDVLCQNIAFDVTKGAEYAANFRRGLEQGAKARELALAEVGTIFPE